MSSTARRRAGAWPARLSSLLGTCNRLSNLLNVSKCSIPLSLTPGNFSIYWCFVFFPSLSQKGFSIGAWAIAKSVFSILGYRFFLSFALQTLSLNRRTSRFVCSTCLQVHRPLSASLRRAPPLSATVYPATGALPALQLSPTRISHFHRYQSGYVCVASSVPLSDVSLLIPPPSIWLQVL